MSIYVIVIGIFVFVCMSAFFSGAEMAFSSCNQLRMENLRDEGVKSAGAAVKILERFDDAQKELLSVHARSIMDDMTTGQLCLC